VEHFNEWLDFIQYKKIDIPSDILDDILSRCYSEITIKELKQILTDLKYNKYYEYIHYIYGVINNNLKSLDQETEEQVKQLFLKVNSLYNNYKFALSNYFILVKLLEIIATPSALEFISYIQLPKSKEKLMILESRWQILLKDLAL
jgi:hypothetical protein